MQCKSKIMSRWVNISLWHLLLCSLLLLPAQLYLYTGGGGRPSYRRQRTSVLVSVTPSVYSSLLLLCCCTTRPPFFPFPSLPFHSNSSWWRLDYINVCLTAWLGGTVHITNLYKCTFVCVSSTKNRSGTKRILYLQTVETTAAAAAAAGGEATIYFYRFLGCWVLVARGGGTVADRK